MRLKFNNINISLMKKYIMVAAVASVALASCTKNEVKPVEVEPEKGRGGESGIHHPVVRPLRAARGARPERIFPLFEAIEAIGFHLY